MLDNEKDHIIKKELQKDKYISKQANDVFQNFYKMNSYEASNQTEKITNDDEKTNYKEIHIKSNNKMLFRWKALISVAASFVIVFSAGIAVYVNKDKINNYNSNLVASNEDTQTSIASIIGGKNAADYKSVTVKNTEVTVAENSIFKSSENDMIKAIVTSDGMVEIQLKQNFMSTYNLNLDTNKYYRVHGINKKIKDIFVGYIDNSYKPYVLLLLNDNTVEYVQVVSGAVSEDDKDTFEFYFDNQGKIIGLESIIGFEQRTEYRENELHYYIVAISSTGVEKEIELEEYNDMTEQNAISEADIIDTKEDDNMIAYLHEDGCITIMFKTGGINRITDNASGVIKENVKYNFSLKELLYQYPDQEFKATAIFVGKIGAKKEECLAFGTSYNIFKMFDVAKYLEEANINSFNIETNHLSMYLIDRTDEKDSIGKITSIEPVTEKIKLIDEDSIVECTTLKWNTEEGSSKTYPSIALMLKEGFHDENGIGNMEVIDENNNIE